MRLTIRLFTLVAAVLTLAMPLTAQAPEGISSEYMRDVTQLETKIVGLAKAIPASAYEWRPGKGVRSTSEVFMHVAADNYFIPGLIGNTAPAETGITKEYKTAEAFEKKPMKRDEVIAELEKSFAFLKSSLKSVPEEKMTEPVDFFGRKNTTRGAWLITITHLHEHLGQLIAYARSNNVTPPWSK